MIPRYLSFSPETTPAATHYGWRAASSAAAFTKSLPTIVAGTLLRIISRAKPTILAATVTHGRRTTLRARGTMESSSSTATPGVALTVPVLRTVAPETTPAAIHHGWRAAWSAAASMKSLPTVVAGTLLRIISRAKPAILAATATHGRRTTLRARDTTELILSTFAIAAPRWRWLDGLVAEFCAPALHHALACLLWIEVPRDRVLQVKPTRTGLSLGNIPAAEFQAPTFHHALERLLGARVLLRRVVLSAKVHGADEQPSRRSHRTRHHRSHYRFHITRNVADLTLRWH